MYKQLSRQLKSHRKLFFWRPWRKGCELKEHCCCDPSTFLNSTTCTASTSGPEAKAIKNLRVCASGRGSPIPTVSANTNHRPADCYKISRCPSAPLVLLATWCFETCKAVLLCRSTGEATSQVHVVASDSICGEYESAFMYAHRFHGG